MAGLEAVEELVLPYRWRPRGYQEQVWAYFRAGGTRAVVCWPRRHGKDEVGLHHMACASQQRVGNYWYMLPEYAQARKSVWDAINPHTGIRRIDEAFPVLMRKASGGTHDQEMKITCANGSTIQLVGSDNFTALLGSPPVGLVFSEWKVADPTAWGYLRPILLENKGWAYFNSTPLGKNHFYTLCQMAAREPGWFYEKLTNDDTCLFSEAEMQRELREMQQEHGEAYGRALWLQEYYTSFEAAVPGSIWGDALEQARLSGRIVDCALDPVVAVDTGWDLGRTDDTAIWFRQMNGTQMDVVDYHESNLKDIAFYVDLLLAKRAAGGWRYGTHWLPHDARPRTLAAGGKSILQQFDDAGRAHPELGRFAIAPRLDRQEGIQAGRATIRVSRFHATRCAAGLERLKLYHRVWDTEKQMFQDVPEHDASSHAADAWRTLSVTWKVARPAQPDSPLEDKLLRGNPATQTMGHLRERLFRRKRAEREWSLS